MVRIIENYTLYEVIGEGAYGKVYRAINKTDNKEYAIKVIEVKKFQNNKKLQQCTVHEINILTNIEKNPHIICYYDMLKTQNNFYFVYEYCNGGTLDGLLRKQNRIEQKKALLIFRQLLQAFQVLNKYNIMHRDLKPDNIFFHNDIIKVGDFGFCKSLEKAEMTKTMLGSPIYMAPEILNGQIYSNKADIWSIGVVLYEMLYGYCPFESSSIPKLIEVLKETQLDFPGDVYISNQTKTLLKRILTKDPQRRIQWMELFQLKISDQGKISEQSNGKVSLDDKDIMKSIREVSDASDDTASSSFVSQRNMNQGQNNYSNYTPKNVTPPPVLDMNKSQKSDEKQKMAFTRKAQTSVEEANPIPSPSRRPRVSQGGNIKEITAKFHEDIVRGINIIRSMGLNNQKYTPLFSYHLFRCVSERMKKFREEQLINSQSPEAKQFKQIFQQEIDELQYEINGLKNKVEEFADWKKAVKAKVLEFRNLRLCYQLVMFLCGQPSNQNISHNEMSYVIRSKIA